MFTINNPMVDCALTDQPERWSHVKYCIYQLEQGTNGTPHYQGYVCFTKKMYLTGVKKFSRRAHWEVRRGTHDDAKAYCSKADTRLTPTISFGEEPLFEPGKRNDMLSLKRALDAGKSEFEISDDPDLFGVWARNTRAIERYKRLRTVNSRNWPTHTTVLWGPPGSGKTKYVHEHAGESVYWVKKPNGNSTFFDGYDGQTDVVIDEFYAWLAYDLLCRMCDRYPLMVDTKGGMTNFFPERIWITSNKRPDEWYRRGLGALKRRFSPPLGRVVYCGEDWDQLIKQCDIPHFFATSAEAQVAMEDHIACSEERCLVERPFGREDVSSNDLICNESLEDLWCNHGNTIDDCDAIRMRADVLSEDEIMDAQGSYGSDPERHMNSPPMSPKTVTDFRRFFAKENIPPPQSVLTPLAGGIQRYVDRAEHGPSCICGRCVYTTDFSQRDPKLGTVEQVGKNFALVKTCPVHMPPASTIHLPGGDVEGHVSSLTRRDPRLLTPEERKELYEDFE